MNKFYITVIVLVFSSFVISCQGNQTSLAINAPMQGSKVDSNTTMNQQYNESEDSDRQTASDITNSKLFGVWEMNLKKSTHYLELLAAKENVPNDKLNKIIKSKEFKDFIKVIRLVVLNIGNKIVVSGSAPSNWDDLPKLATVYSEDVKSLLNGKRLELVDKDGDRLFIDLVNSRTISFTAVGFPPGISIIYEKIN